MEDANDKTYRPPAHIPESDSCFEEDIILDSDGNEVVKSLSEGENEVSLCSYLIDCKCVVTLL